MTPDRARPGLLARRARALVSSHRRLFAALFVGAAAAGLPSPVVASSGGGRRITDAENTRTVYLVVAALVLLAVGLAAFTWWFWRSTRRDHESLAPLEVMGDRKFVAGDVIARQTLLDSSRPVGAAPLAPGAAEPLIVAPAGDSPHIVAVPALAVGGDETSALAVTNGHSPVEAPTTVVPITDDEAEVVTGRTAAPGATPAMSNADPAATNGDTGESAADPAQADADAVAEPAAPSGAASTPDGAGLDGEPAVGRDEQATMAIDTIAAVTARDEQATMAIEAVAVAAPVADHTSGPGDGAQQTEFALGIEHNGAANGNGTNGATVKPALIDPGLPVPPADEPPARQLSLAELVALDAGAPVGFDDDPMVSTPSTGIPVVESAEAWVERQLAAAKAARVEGEQEPQPAGVDDPDEPPAITVGDAE